MTFCWNPGSGFAFIGRQIRLTLDGDHFYPDLIFYHARLKCYVVIDLKVDKLNHGDLGKKEIYCLISKSGFTKRMKKLAANDNVLLFDLKDLEMEFLGGNGGVPQPESADRSAYISSDTDQRL